ncbi:MAG: phytanoyl-CoA dioxygenase family protein [Candidatus Latescibacterota bacterium]|nr:phytanoyl-CoA dioxygenase family protein [Candidatus Latescibacterota bacterium]
MNKSDLPTLRAQTYCRELREESVVTDLFRRSSLHPLAEDLLGVGNVERVKGGQIALRFPILLGSDPAPLRGHLDGLGSGQNGMERGVYRRGFSGLAVVYLSEVGSPFSGNFTVWPGSHRLFEQFFRDNGHEVLADGMPQIELPEPVQIVGRPGDAVITHHQIVHTAAPNASCDIRYAAIFRLRHREVEAVGLDAYTDIWREWPGIREAAVAD